MTAELLTRQRPARGSVATTGLAASTVALQIAYPLVDGSRRGELTVVTVLLFALTCVAHVATTRGARTALRVLLVTAVPGFAVEVLGVHTGMPFGHYAYATSLGPRVLGVPPVVGLAWTMLAWPAAVAARRLVPKFGARVLVGGWAIASADLFLDPQLVAAGHWHWTDPTPHLPGVADVPLTNLAGWLVVGLALSFAVQSVLRDAPAPVGSESVALALYLWLYVGWIVALGAFLDLRAAALWGAVGMGTVAVPLFARLVTDARDTHGPPGRVGPTAIAPVPVADLRVHR